MTHRGTQVLAVAAAVLAAAALPASGQPFTSEDYLPEDVRITGKEMYTFMADGELVCVVLGDFGMTVGPRRLSGRDAALWIRQSRSAGQMLRQIQLYIEGDAEVVEPAGTTTRDHAILVTVRHKGAFRAAVGARLERAQEDLPVYVRGLAMRKTVVGQAAPPPEPGPPQAVATPPTAGPDEGEAERPGEGGLTAEDAPARLITYRAGEISSKETTVDGLPQRVTICKGNVYLSQGTADQAGFLEMRADTAVLFSAQSQTPKDAERADFADRPGAERIVSAYLEGDVVLSRGERSIRGSRLYYDFVKERAVILDVVLRTIQKQRNVPIIIRAAEARRLSRQEMWFRSAKVSTSEFHTPTYHIGASRAYMMDTTPYDEKGEPLAEESYRLRMKHTTYNIRGLPVWYWPWLTSDAQTGDVPLRRIQAGDHGRFGLGVESQWFLFRTLGLLRPEGFRGTLDLNAYEKGTVLGMDVDYARQAYAGLLMAYGVRDNEREDDFGRDRKDVPAPADRGRFLWRHKQFLSDDWQVQGEFSYLCDRNFLEQFFRNEFWAGKEQESLLQIKKQRDNWALTALVQGRINDFLTTTEAMPDLGLYLIGQPFWEDRLTLFSESHLGVLRYRPDHDLPWSSSDSTVRADTRAEVNAPMRWGPINVSPYAFTRLTYWSDAVDGDDLARALGGGGIRANAHLWRVYENVQSRLLDIHRLRHVVTPEVVAFASAGHNQAADRLWPFSPGIEEQLETFQGVALGVKQRWQTYRGGEGHQTVADFARLNLWGVTFNDTPYGDLPADGRLFFDRPEYSIVRNAINGDFVVNFSDATALLGDMNYDLNDDEIGWSNIAVAVQRDPRLRYYLGLRHTDDLDSAVGTAGLHYRINRKYQFSAFQQYDFEFDGGDNLTTQISIVRKMPRWYAAVTLVVDRSSDDVGVIIALWPEGVPEFRIGGSGLGAWAASDLN